MKPNTCAICGWTLVLARGRHPGDDNRWVCPTCLADRMDDIHEMTSRDYGKAFQAESNPVLKGPAPLAGGDSSRFDPPNPLEPE